jgi:regulator of sigma E protease
MSKMFGEEWIWEDFWNRTAFLSVVLAFMNLLPIPALDGGHVVFTLYEMITRRAPSVKVLTYAQYVGMGILLLLMLYANLNDFVHFFK